MVLPAAAAVLQGTMATPVNMVSKAALNIDDNVTGKPAETSQK